MPTSDFKPFATGPGNEVVLLSDYQSSAYLSAGFPTGLLTHDKLNRALRQATVPASAFMQVVADYLNVAISDDGDVSGLITKIKQALSASGLAFVPGGSYPTGSLGDYLNHLAAGGSLTADQLIPLLAGLISETQLAGQLLNRINLIDAPTTGLVTKVGDLTTTYGSTASAAASASAAVSSAAAALASQNAASISAGAAFTSETNANTSKLAAATSAGAASTSAGAAATSATSAAGSASSASTSASTASTSATAAGASATAAATSATAAATSATNAGTFATAASSSATTAATSASAASVSAGQAATSATTAAGSASTATSQAALAASSASNAANSAAAAAAAGAAVGGLNLVVRNRATIATVDLSWGSGGWGFRVVGNGATQGLLQIDVSPLAANTPYSVSFKAKVIGGVSSAIALAFLPSGLPSTSITVGTDGTVVYTWQNVSSSSSSWTTAQLRADVTLAGGVTLEITDIKVEQGATATAYTPSPVDLRNYANAALTSANNATSQATSAVAAASAASTSATQASTFASQSAGSAGTASTSATQASTSATNAAGSATNASSAATAAANSASTAAGSASSASVSSNNAGTSATSAQTSANAAAASATAAATSASNASTLASQASTSASNAAGNAASASTNATAAATSATNASGSATAASTSASSASTSASNAAASASAASNWYTQTVAATGSLSTSVTQLQSSQATTAGEVTTLQSQWLLKAVATRADGKVVLGGIGVGATANNNVGQSSIVLTADSLIFVPSSDPNAAPAGLFTVGTVNGVVTLVVPSAIIGDLTVGTNAVANNLTTRPLYANANSFSYVYIDVTLTAADARPGTNLVQVEIVASQVTTAPKWFELSSWNLGFQTPDMSQHGNLISSLPPGGVLSYTYVFSLPIGSHRIAFYNSSGGNAGLADAQDVHRDLGVIIHRR